MGTFIAIFPLVFLASQAVCKLVVHESRDEPLENAIDRQRIEPDALLPMRIALHQNEDALAQAEGWLMDVSDPDSPNFGRHWVQEDVLNAFAPAQDTIDAVQSWLSKNGIENVTHTENKQWLAFDLRANKAETLLQTQYLEHFNSERNTFEVSCDQYSLPEDLRKHVDFVMPAVHAKDITGRTERSIRYMTKHPLQRRSTEEDDTKTTTTRKEPSTLSSASNSASASFSASTAPPCVPNDLSCCSRSVSPACLRELYHFSAASPDAKVSSKNRMGLFEDYPVIRQIDMNEFFDYYTHIPNQTDPVYDAIDGAITRLSQTKGWRKQFLAEGLGYGTTESTLDAQCIFPIVYPQNVTVFQTNDAYWSNYDFTHTRDGLFNTFLDALDGSYCSFSAFGQTGDNPSLDPIYPDPRAHGYKGELQCGVFKPTNVISMSYGTYEINISYNYQKRQCLEFLKLALQGVSFFVSSGDVGVGPCTRPPKTGIFGPITPNGCPWITVVGATQIPKNGAVFHPEISTPWSGGGFSNVFDRPKYQDAVVSEYFEKHDPGIAYYYNGNFRNSSGRYNRNGRAYPDVAANGLNIATIIDGRYAGSQGTSASTPIFASLINRIVEERIKAGKGALGFINPTLYKNPWALNDILVGGNQYPIHYEYECTQGFKCVPGWEPVAGFGTPNYPKLLKLFMDLP